MTLLWLALAVAVALSYRWAGQSIESQRIGEVVASAWRDSYSTGGSGT